MAMLDDRTRKQVEQAWQALKDPVKLVVFTQSADALECEFCSETRQLVGEIASTSPKLSVEVRDFKADADAVSQYRIDKIPALAIVGAKDYGIRYFGIPSGYEFGSLIHDVVRVSSNESGLSKASKEALARVRRPVHLQVYVTPT